MIKSAVTPAWTIDTNVDARGDITVGDLAAAADARFVVLLSDGLIATNHSEYSAFFSLRDLKALSIDLENSVFLGKSRIGPIIAVRSNHDVNDVPEPFSSSRLLDILADMMFSDVEREAISRGCSLLSWNQSQAFCGQCGTRTVAVLAGFRRDCPNCTAISYPRVDPAVIMLPVFEDKCLLGRGPKFKTGWFTALSGFVEPGESLERAIFREVQEEAGVIISTVSLCASQPWPFPHSIMIGAICEVSDPTIKIERHELEDCRWFTREETTQIRDGTHPDGFHNRSKNTLAAKLIDSWIRGCPSVELDATHD